MRKELREGKETGAVTHTVCDNGQILCDAFVIVMQCEEESGGRKKEKTG